MTRSSFRVSIAILATIIQLTVLGGEPPAIERLFPAGGQAGATVNVEFKGKPGDQPLQLWSSLDGLTMQVADDAKTSEITVAQDAASGIHWLRFYNEFGSTELLPFVVGNAPEIIETEPNDHPDQATVSELTTAVANGVLSKSGDVDVFKVELTEGSTLVAAVEANSVPGSPMDAVLQLLDKHGTVIAQNDDDRGFDPRIVWPVTESGTYYLRLFAFPETPNSTIRFAGGDSFIYRLMFTDDKFVDHTMPLVTASDGSSTSLALHGWNLSGLKQVSSEQLSTLNRIHGVISCSLHRVNSSDLPIFPETEQTDSPPVRDIPFCGSGTIQTDGEKDNWTIRGAKGQKLTISVEARDVGSLLDPVLAVFKPDGSLLKEFDDVDRENLDINATVTLPIEGEYQLQIFDRYSHGSDRHFYLLSCSSLMPVYRLSVSNTQFAFSESNELEIPVTINRESGFSGTIDVQIAGLPEHIGCEVVQSIKGEESEKKITLKLTRTPNAGFHGPIKIVGSSGADNEESGTKMEKTATASVPGLSPDSHHLWLTAPPVESESSEQNEDTE